MKKNLLVVSDSKNFHLIIEAILKDSYEVLYAENEDDAFYFANLYPVRLLILTPKIRGKDGFGFIEKLRGQNTHWSEIPVLFAPAYVNADVIAKAHKYSVSDIVRTPFEPIAFSARVDELITKFAPSREQPDPVTGLRKKQFASEQITELLAQGKKGALMLVELDHYSFASTSVSDKTLIACRNIIQEEIDDNAVLSVARDGGFLIFVQDLREREKVQEYADRVIKKILERVENEKVYVAIGLAVSERHGKDFPDLYLACDKGLGVSRAQGKNSANFYSW